MYLLSALHRLYILLMLQHPLVDFLWFHILGKSSILCKMTQEAQEVFCFLAAVSCSYHKRE